VITLAKKTKKSFRLVKSEKDYGPLLLISFIIFLGLLAAYVAMIKYGYNHPDNGEHQECIDMCAQFNLTGIMSPGISCQCYRLECVNPSQRGTLYYKCNWSDQDNAFFLQTGMGEIEEIGEIDK